MNCSACNHENRPGAKFCEECAAPLKRLCAGCGAELRPTAKFCDECGAPTAAAPTKSSPARPAEAPGARKVVTIIFGDLVGSTALHERLDAESVRQFMESYYAAMRGAVEAHGGRVTQVMGDGVKAVFGAPRVAEDDALRAVRAAVEMQRAFHALAEQQRGRVGKTGLRVAVNTGEVVADDATEIIGDPVNVAARLQEQGRDGDVVIGGSTQRIVASHVTLDRLGSFALKGRSEQVEAYRVVSLEPPAGATTAAFVGRDEELARLTAVYAAAIAKPATGLAVLLGSPGLGKSRLIDEFGRRHADTATVLMAHCDAAGGATFAPLAEALRRLLGLDDGASGEALGAALEAALPGADAESARIITGIVALLAGSPASPEETFFVVRRLLAALATERPLVLVIDDLHWAEPLLLDLVEHLVQWGSGVPLLVLVSARPELREMRSSLATPGGLVADVLMLTGLDAGAAMRLAAGVIGAADLPAAIAAKVLATSEGNPLFVAELVKMLVQEGALRREGERWVAGAGLASLEMPPTIHALLAARIERLRPEERSVLERAAVVGRHFSRSAVAELLPRDVADLDVRLEALRRSELIERDSGWFLGEPVLRFHHVLIRYAAYRGLLKNTRAELHERFAAWIEARVGASVDQDETIGWHLEQAHQHLSELGPLDPHGRALGERAARRLAAAGRRALMRDDAPLAASLLGRALARLDPDDPTRAELALDWCEALLSAGDVGPAAAAVDELGRLSAGSARLTAWHTCFAGQHSVLTAPQSLHETADAVAAAARELGTLEDSAGEARAHFVHALALGRLGKVGACEAALDRALTAARRAGDNRRSNAVLAIAPLAALWGPSPVTRASGRCLDVVRVLRITQGAPAVEAVALSCQGVLEALRGRTDAARRMIASSRKMVEELGITQRLLEADVFAARIELLEGDAPAAERALRVAYEGQRELGLGSDAAQTAALLARALLAQDRAAEAEALSHESEALAGDDLQAAIAWRGVRAEALARRGECKAAIELAETAVAIAAATDALLDHADARLALAAALRAAGRGKEADAEEQRATELWEAKGATLLAERARRDRVQGEALAPSAQERVEPARSPARRVRANAATAAAARYSAAITAREFDALADLHAVEIEVFHHPTGASYGREGALTLVRQLIAARGVESRNESLAALGDSLALAREMTSFDALDDDALGPFGAVERERLSLVEVDASGRARRVEHFAAEHLGDAISRLYERYAELLPEGPARTSAAATARSVAAMLTASTDQDFEASVAPTFEAVDHRLVGHESVPAEALQRGFAATSELEDERRFRVDDVLGLRGDAFLRRTTHSGIVRASGGPFERTVWALTVFRADGRITRHETFDVGQEALALARFDELTATLTPRTAFANTATRAFERGVAALAAGDWERFGSLFAPSFRHVDRRALFQLESDREQWLAGYRQIVEMTSAPPKSEVLATRGDRLLLAQLLWQGAAGDIGPSEIDWLLIIEVDERGDHVAVINFDAGDLGSAYAELDARYEAGEGARQRGWAVLRAFQRAVESRDWSALALEAPGQRRDHRLVGFGTTQGPASYVDMHRTLFELAPDSHVRFDHVICSNGGALFEALWQGTRDGGAFEIALIGVSELDEQGRVRCYDIYDTSQLDQALARFEGLGRDSSLAPPGTGFENAAARADRTLMHCFNTRDWAGVLACAAPELVFDERRRMVRNTCGREIWLEQFRLLFDVPASRFSIRLLATRGERLALSLHGFAGEVAGGGGPLAMDDHFALHEVDREGRIVAIVLFDEGDLEAATAELDARYAAGEGVVRPHESAWLRAFLDSFAGRDWDALAALVDPAFVARDHRLVGWGTRHGPAEWVTTMRALVDLAADSEARIDHVRTADRALLFEGAWVGTREGGSFESPFVAVVGLDARGQAVSLDPYDPQHLDQALARFEALGASAPQGPLAALVKPNAASGWLSRFQSVFNRRDWDALPSLYAPDATYEDRQRFSRLSGGLDLLLSSVRARADAEARLERFELLGTAGDRVDIVRVLFAGGGAGDRFEMELVSVVEVDEAGRLVANVNFDTGDARAAQREAWARWAAIDPVAAAVVAPLSRVLDACNAQDRGRLRTVFADDLVAEDHRHAGIGRLEGADAYVESVVALWELAPDAQQEAGWRWLAQDRHGAITVVRRHGVLPEGGAFESEYLYLYTVSRGLLTRLEGFELDAAGAALARFEELRPDPLRIPPNASTRANDRWWALAEAKDWDAVRALSAGMVFEDRRRLIRLTGGGELLLADTRHLWDAGWRPVRTLLATAGERLSLERMLWTLEAGGQVSEIEVLKVAEIDAEGRIVAFLIFDPDDRAAAHADLLERWLRLGADGVSPTTIEFLRAWNAHDLGRMRALLPGDYVFHDHRRTGIGRIEGAEPYIASLAALWELSPDVRLGSLYTVAQAPHGFVGAMHWFGTNNEGGEIEALFVAVSLIRGGRQVGAELFEIEDLEAALARFEELRPDPLRIPPNAAARASARHVTAFLARDWAACRSLASDDFVYEDRGKRALVKGDVETLIASMQFIAALPEFDDVVERIATLGDRIVLEHMVWSGGPEEEGFEIPHLRLLEVDAPGRMRALILFDPDDRAAAFDEAQARFLAGEAAGVGGQAPVRAIRAFDRHDWEALLELLTSDFVFDDHRMLGLGVLDRERWVGSVQAQDDLTRDLAVEDLRVLAWNRRGRVTVRRTFGTNLEGGPFENVFAQVMLCEGDRIQRLEVFDLDDAERAVARFHELCGARTA